MARCVLLLVLSSFLLQSLAAQKPYKGGSGKYQKLVWSDEFNGTGLPDTTKWGFEKGYVRNKELQYYTASRTENARLENGFLHITALNDSLRNDTSVYAITSASLHSKGKGEWTYGRMEVRAKDSFEPRHLARHLDAGQRHRQHRLAGVRRNRYFGTRGIYA
jgi:beta-glucanase (GH16 family)